MTNLLLDTLFNTEKEECCFISSINNLNVDSLYTPKKEFIEKKIQNTKKKQSNSDNAKTCSISLRTYDMFTYVYSCVLHEVIQRKMLKNFWFVCASFS